MDNDLWGSMYLGARDLWGRMQSWTATSGVVSVLYNPENGQFRPILDGVQSSRFYYTLGQAQRSAQEQYSDSWDKFFSRAKMFSDNGMDITADCDQMCNIMMTRDEKMREMVKKHFTPEDYFAVRDHMVGTGMIGGKACGMLLARAIIRNREPDINDVLYVHDPRGGLRAGVAYA